jgi:Zn ribbon nucleic-acid-binding protein
MSEPIEMTEEMYHALDNGGGGVCLQCREVDAQLGWCEPDAEKRECAYCGAHAWTCVE